MKKIIYIMKLKSKYHICLKYSGLDIPYILETDLFFIIPSDYKQKLNKRTIIKS